MSGTPASNFPPMAPTVKLAEKKAKAEKCNSLCRSSFPMESVADYQPAWAVEQVCGFILTFVFMYVAAPSGPHRWRREC